MIVITYPCLDVSEAMLIKGAPYVTDDERRFADEMWNECNIIINYRKSVTFGDSIEEV